MSYKLFIPGPIAVSEKTLRAMAQPMIGHRSTDFVALYQSITPQLQEIVYRAMEREPKNRYASAREMAHDLLHQDEVGVAARPDAEQWKMRRSPERRRMFLYAALALIPLVLFGLLLFVSRHH